MDAVKLNPTRFNNNIIPIPVYCCSCQVPIPHYSETIYQDLPEWTSSRIKSDSPRSYTLQSLAGTGEDDQYSMLTPNPIQLHMSPPVRNMTIKPATVSQAEKSVPSKPNKSPKKQIEGQLFINSNGTLSITIAPSMELELTVDGALRLSDNQSCTFISVNNDGSRSAFSHACGQAVQFDYKVNLSVLAEDKNNKHAKMWPEGISFRSDQSALTFLTDIAGTKSSNDNFKNLTVKDYTKTVFITGSVNGKSCIPKCYSILHNFRDYVSKNGRQHYVIGDVEILKTDTGTIRVYKEPCVEIKIGPGGRASLITSYVQCSASNNPASKHMFVRCQDNRIHYDGKKFAVRCGSQKAGFDEDNKIRIF